MTQHCQTYMHAMASLHMSVPTGWGSPAVYPAFIPPRKPFLTSYEVSLHLGLK